MSSRKEKLLNKINPKLLEVVPKLNYNVNSNIDLNLENETLKNGAKELMLRFYNEQEVLFHKISNENGIELCDNKYRESYKICELISGRLSLPFSNKNSIKLERPGTKLQDLKKSLEEKMSIKRKEEYHKRVKEYHIWKREMLINEEEDLENSDDLEAKYFLKENRDDLQYSNIEKNDNNKIKISNNENFDNNDINENDVNNDYNNDDNDDDKYNDNDVDDNNYDNYNDSDDNNDDISSCKQISVINTDINNGNNIDDVEISSHNKKNKIVGDSQSISCRNVYIYSPVKEKKIIKANNIEDIVENSNENEIMNINKCSFLPLSQIENEIMCSVPEQTQDSQDLLPHLQSPSLKLILMNMSQSEKNLNQSPIKENYSEKENTLSFLQKSKLFSDSQNLSQYDLNDAFEFCSGKFPEDASPKSLVCNTELEYKNLNDNNSVKNKKNVYFKDDLNDNEQKKSLISESKKRIITHNDESDDEISLKSEDEIEEPYDPRVTSDEENDFGETVKFIRKGGRQTLNFSDEEDDSSDVHTFHHIENEEKNEEPESSDSEENFSSTDFLEKEAEKSGSEESDDEEEEGLDEYEEEEGDKENFDFNKIQSQLKKIHMKHMADDDSWNIRYIKELFFEDGDLLADENNKKFKWKNLIKSEEEQPFDSTFQNSEIKMDSSDEEDSEDLQMRKERLQKQVNSEKLEDKKLSFESDVFKNGFQKLKVTTLRNQFKGNKSIIHDQKNFAKSPVYSAVNSISIIPDSTRGSFLKRNEVFLTRLAKVTSNVDTVRGPNNSKNFVFAATSPEKSKTELETKRKFEEMDNLKLNKKPKLLVDTTNSIPFILDLLE